MAYQTIIDTIYCDMDSYQRIHELLTAQKKNLFSRNNPALVKIASEITTLLQQAHQRSDERSASLETLGLPNTEEGMTQFFGQLEPMLEQNDLEQLQADWETLVTLVKDCKAINSVNGKLLELQKQTADRVMSQLKGQEKNSGVYSQNGQTTEMNRPILQMKA